MNKYESNVKYDRKHLTAEKLASVNSERSVQQNTAIN